ncbi:F-box protein At1g80960-like isoform X2 [Arabidopsis lyrata subsp. lyrata]|uniref:F-box protein At1g80960-like isoform X2 n=1 Tax=Arabidopsis lyrata subsp. lyrata TaxID=81972 RepID=UPI000A29D57F|nr:F-box protein At1g80960-like isoform X2 [Arabidopsis lyrata subsp. lyrata]|eukprot:XP_020891168.1 F-box protein At1g80960-like isoform X2 [Arabidopsis lyrata subsp. lyrata]
MERLSSPSVPVENVDWISKLPNDLLLMILSRLSTDEAVRTSVVSKRWEHVWKHMSHLVLDMRKKIASSKYTPEVSKLVATLMTKIINNHRGHLESCVIDHYTDGMLNTWIQSLTGARQTKHLTLRHHLKLTNCGGSIDFPPNSFSYLGLTSLSLSTYIFRTSHSFNNCKILKTLKLSCMMAPDVGVFNRVLASCPSLEVLVLHITFQKRNGHLKIGNKRLKLLKVSFCNDIDGIQVSSPSLHILAIDEILSYGRYNFVLTSPRLQFSRDYKRTCLPHISYNISQEENCIGHGEFVVNTCGELLRVRLPASLSVSVDLMNRREVERLRQVLLLWSFTMAKLEIFFKNNAPREEGESSPNKLWEENNKKDWFHNAKFRVDSVWMYNFSGSEEEFALASCLIRQRMVVKKMMIKMTSFPARKKLEIETAVVKLQALKTKDQWDLTIKCF